MVTREEMMSMMDGFLGYNQVLMVDEDHHKTTFTTLWVHFLMKEFLLG